MERTRLFLLRHGQVEGFSEKYGMEFRRARLDERPNDGFRLLACTSAIGAEVTFEVTIRPREPRAAAETRAAATEHHSSVKTFC